ncbi:hypothetical protein KC332_g17047 [Hortaea werneckii]|uniref:Uncharacterized protein n=1 Tax=Hortaea werneckii TaxID=91943 RepID=A0A3M7IR46_HORWE|nr:hypothetical protein KC350_g17709 [Hortaea werneckii]KAI6794770.1 hypothetical protein KC358_g17063 [Hortaea werneckii]KAI6899751.1 hypothetical protein KC348_g17041 [Hortaea werneckii]KAI6919887.1 hypothetical protein KC341_g16986 [Hortaea werneckii]KAI6952940.1 hypothetical protein KC321_g17273 [Hortaea werneckii]
MASSRRCHEVTTYQHWFNELKHPAISLGPSLVIPAFILPIAVAVLFIILKIRKRRTSQPAADHIPNIEKDKCPSSDEKTKPPDAENNIPSAVAPGRPLWKRLLHWLLQFFHGAFTFLQGLADINNASTIYKALPLWAAGLEILSLLLAGFVLDPSKRAHCGMAALAWAAWASEKWLGATNSLLGDLASVATVVHAALLTGDMDDPGSSTSATALIVLVLDAHLPPDSAIRGPVIIGRQLWPLGVMVFFLVMGGLVRLLRYAYGQDQAVGSVVRRIRDDISSELHTIFSDRKAVLYGVSVVFEYVVALGIAILVGGLLNTCLSWQWLILGFPPSTPFHFDWAFLCGAVVAGYFLWVIADVQGISLQASDPDPSLKDVLVIVVRRSLKPAMALGADAVGVASVALCLVWALAMQFGGGFAPVKRCSIVNDTAPA